MHASLQKTLIILAVSALPLTAFAADKHCTAEPKAKWQMEKAVQATLEKQGYTVKRIKTEGSCYEAYVRGKDGKKAELMINPVTAELVGEEGKS